MEIRRLSALLICGFLSRGDAATTSSAAAAENGTLPSSSSSSLADDDDAPVIMMDTGSFHAVVIIRDSMTDVVKNWGANGKGQVRKKESRRRKKRGHNSTAAAAVVGRFGGEGANRERLEKRPLRPRSDYLRNALLLKRVFGSVELSASSLNACGRRRPYPVFLASRRKTDGDRG